MFSRAQSRVANVSPHFTTVGYSSGPTIPLHVTIVSVETEQNAVTPSKTKIQDYSTNFKKLMVNKSAINN